MDGWVGLSITGEVERIDAHFPFDRYFEDTGADQFSLVKDFARQAGIGRYDFHERSFRGYVEVARCEKFSVSCSASTILSSRSNSASDQA